jgi:hypothetical protein
MEKVEENNMKLFELLKKYTDEEICTRLFEIYPKEKESHEGYIKALAEMRTKKRLRTNSTIAALRTKDEDEWYTEILVYTRGQEFSPSFVKWGQFLNMKVALGEYDPLEVLALCVWEMTWYGYSDQATQEQADELRGISGEAENES